MFTCTILEQFISEKVFVASSSAQSRSGHSDPRRPWTRFFEGILVLAGRWNSGQPERGSALKQEGIPKAHVDADAADHDRDPERLERTSPL